MIKTLKEIATCFAFSGALLILISIIFSMQTGYKLTFFAICIVSLLIATVINVFDNKDTVQRKY